MELDMDRVADVEFICHQLLVDLASYRSSGMSTPLKNRLATGRVKEDLLELLRAVNDFYSGG